MVKKISWTRNWRNVWSRHCEQRLSWCLIINALTAEPAKITYDGGRVGEGHSCKVTRPPCKQGHHPWSSWSEVRELCYVASYADILLGSSHTNLALKIPFIAILSRWTQAHLRSLCSKSYVKLASPDVCLTQIDICAIEMILCRCILLGSAHCSHDCWPSALGVLGNINVTLRTSLIAYLVWSIALNLFSFLLEGVCSLYGAFDRRIFIR